MKPLQSNVQLIQESDQAVLPLMSKQGLLPNSFHNNVHMGKNVFLFTKSARHQLAHITEISL